MKLKKKFSWGKMVQLLHQLQVIFCPHTKVIPDQCNRIKCHATIKQFWSKEQGTVLGWCMFRWSEQGAASLTVMAKSLWPRYLFLNDVRRHGHCHLILKMTWSTIIIVTNPLPIVILTIPIAIFKWHFKPKMKDFSGVVNLLGKF